MRNLSESLFSTSTRELEDNRLLFYLNVYNRKSLAGPSNFRQVSDSDDDNARSRLHYLHRDPVSLRYTLRPNCIIC